MIKSELISRIAERNPHLFAKDVRKGVNGIFDEIAAALIHGDRVELRGFGRFIVRTWAPRPLGRNPKTGPPPPAFLRPVMHLSRQAERCAIGLTAPREALRAPRSAFRKP
jgi:integration host factor subunit beta